LAVPTESISDKNVSNVLSLSYSDSESDDEIEGQRVYRMQAYLYKFNEKKNRVKKLWFKLINKDLFCKYKFNIFN